MDDIQETTERPRPTVAVLGASADRRKYGNKSVRAHLLQGYEVFPVNPSGGEIEGLKAWPDLASVPVAQLDRITVYLPPYIGIKLLDQMAAKHPTEVWLNPGAESPELVAKAHTLGLPIIQACSIVNVGVVPTDFDD